MTLTSKWYLMRIALTVGQRAITTPAQGCSWQPLTSGFTCLKIALSLSSHTMGSVFVPRLIDPLFELLTSTSSREFNFAACNPHRISMLVFILLLSNLFRTLATPLRKPERDINRLAQHKWIPKIRIKRTAINIGDWACSNSIMCQ